VYIYQVEYHEGGETLTYRWEVAAFGDFQVFAAYELALVDSSGTDTSAFRDLNLELK